MMTLRASLRSRLSAPLYMREFHFVDEQANRTSHYVVGVTKHIVGLTIMKDIMGKYSSRHENGVASFSREPRVPRQQELLLEDPLDDLKTDLMRRYAGRRLTFAVLIREHFPGTKFDVRHYKLVLGQLAAAGQVQLSGTSTRGAITEKTALHFGP